ncbi:MAG: FAD-dependent oxidoreductase [Planctomycetota bacterium]
MADFTFTQSIDLDDNWDVIVVGGGPAGSTAAVAAAREGATTLLIESIGCLGGMGTAGLVPAWCPFSDKEKLIYRGLAEKVFTLSKAQQPHVAPDAMDWVPIDPEGLKRIYDKLVIDAGVTVRFFTTLTAVQRDEAGGVDAIITASKSGLVALRAKVYVDCTGDGDLAAWAGAEFEKGDENGDLQAATHCFDLSGVDDYHYKSGPWLHPHNPDSPAHRIKDDPNFPDIPDPHMCNNTRGSGTVGFNAGHVFGVDSTDPASLTEAIMLGRRMAKQYRDALAAYHPAAFASSHVVNTGSLMGIRESRRIVGDYRLTIDDYLARKSFPDEIGRNCYYVDIHGSRKNVKGTPEAMKKGSHRYGPGESHGIPYRCLTPRSLRNVLAAGREVSADRAVNGSLRVMPPCLTMGEAAGLAAAMAAGTPDANVHEVNTDTLRERLRAYGAYLP